MWSLTKKTVTGSFLSSGRKLDYRYSPKSDTFWLRFSDNAIAYTRETEFGLVDFDAEGNVVAIEVFGFSKIPPGPVMVSEDEPDMEEDLRRALSSVAEARGQVKIGGGES